jgi:hypothetical protein
VFGLFIYEKKSRGTSFVFLTLTAGGADRTIKLDIENRPELGIDRLGLRDIYIQHPSIGLAQTTL